MGKARFKSRPPMRPRVSMRDAVRAWARRHGYSFFSSLGEFVRRPVASAMTIVVLALALSLPLLLHLAVSQLDAVAGDMDAQVTLSVFAERELSDTEVRRLSARLAARPDVVTADPISPEAGLREALNNLGLATALEDIARFYEDNPLPWVVVLGVDPQASTDALVAQLQDTSGIAQVIVDQAWLQRFRSLLEVGQRLVVILSTLLLLAVVFVVAHAIRMDVHQRRHQIEVMALIGATPGFIRRPFLYSGFWLGTFSSMLAIALVYVVIGALHGPITALADSYGSAFELEGPSAATMIATMAMMGLIGVFGSMIAVHQHLTKRGLN